MHVTVSPDHTLHSLSQVTDLNQVKKKSVGPTEGLAWEAPGEAKAMAAWL